MNRKWIRVAPGYYKWGADDIAGVSRVVLDDGPWWIASGPGWNSDPMQYLADAKRCVEDEYPN